MKIKSKESLLVKTFVQTVSSATSFSKRFNKVCRLLDASPQLNPQQWLYIWRGMYYSVWYSEMTKGCDELIQRIGTYEDVVMLLSGFTALTKDWFGIDVFRLDKYMLLVRVMTNTCIKLEVKALMNDTSSESIDNDVKDGNEDEGKEEDKEEDKEIDDKRGKSKKIKKMFNKRRDNEKKEIVFETEFKAKVIDEMLSIVKSSIGLTLHLTDVVIDEMMKVFAEFRHKLKANQRIEFYFHILLPFVKLMAVCEDHRVLSSLRHNIFDKFKNEVLVSESVDSRKDIMNRLMAAMMTIGGVEAVGKRNRDSIYDLISILKRKVNQLNETNAENKSLKRKKILIGKGRHKKVKYEVTASSPFVTSIVPIPVL